MFFRKSDFETKLGKIDKGFKAPRNRVMHPDIYLKIKLIFYIRGAELKDMDPKEVVIVGAEAKLKEAEAKLKEAQAKLAESEAKLKECQLHLKGHGK